MASIVVSPHNINDHFSAVELFLNSFFNDAFVLNPVTLVLENDTYRITYTKTGVSYHMTITPLSPTIDCKEYHLINPNEASLGGTPIVPQGFRILSQE